MSKQLLNIVIYDILIDVGNIAIIQGVNEF